MLRRVLLALVLATPLLAAGAEGAELLQVIRRCQQRVVKIYGAGGRRQMEAYQTGLLISPDGHVLTALSYVLDADDVAVVLDDGRRFEAEWVGSDPVLELAVLKLPAEDNNLPHFSLDENPAIDVGDRVLAFSNLYGIATGDEPVSVLHGIVSATAPLAARRGRFQANYRGPVYVIDAHANNPGAAGGALVDWQGRLVGVLGKELRSSATGAWLNYALPVDVLADSIDSIVSGRPLDDSQLVLPPPEEPLTAADLGISMVPDLLSRTPPYIDAVIPESIAATVGLQPDDLIVFVGSDPTASCREFRQILAQFESSEQVRLSVLRNGELLEFVLGGSAVNDSQKSTIKFVEEETNSSETSEAAD